MYYKSKKLAYYLVVIIILIACKSALYIPTTENVAKNVNMEELQKGRAMYIEKCSSCHALYLPEKYSKKVWEKNVNEMAPKAKITDEEKQLILSYVTKGE